MKLPFKIENRKMFIRRTILCFIAIFGMGFFLSFLILVDYGTDPCTFMNLSVSRKIGWSLGNWQVTMNLVLLIIMIIFRRRLIGPGTLFNMVLIGYYADFFCWLWKKVIPDRIFNEAPSRQIVFALALAAFIVSAAVYMKSESGLSPYDGLAQILADLSPAPFFVSRIIFDLAAIGIGVLAGGKPSVGHFLMAVGLGPVIQIVGRFIGKFVGTEKGE